MPDTDESAAGPRTWFPATRQPPPNTFEIGVVLAGAVSAGAYTAGVLDFLFEALDTWHAAKRADVASGRTGDDRTVPHHDVRINIVTGASAGGMNGAIAAVALRYDYPRAWSEEKAAAVRAGGQQAAADAAANPFYAAWVDRIDITKLLGTADLGDAIYSMLDCSVLEAIVDQILAYRGAPLADAHVRAWLPNPLPLVLTVTNLRGVPYQIIFRGDRGGQAHEMSLHQDHMAFAIDGLGPPQRHRPLPPDFLRLGEPGGAAWPRLGAAALATGAFPVGLRARGLRRPGSDYDMRHPIVLSDGGDPVFSLPAWRGGKVPADYDFLCVDGGVMNNEPFEIARLALAGLNGRNPRDGREADRAVLMVDPFVEPGAEGPSADVDLVRVFFGMVGAMKNQARFTPRDRALIQSEDVYSRFMIAPSRTPLQGAAAIASGGLGAFLGFFSRDYRHHDFMLGRRNCQRFLETSFTLPEDNPLFDTTCSPAARKKYRDKDKHLPIIPRVGPCAIEEPQPAWPRARFAYGRVESLVERRVDRIVELALARASGADKAKSMRDRLKAASVRAYLWPIAHVARGRIKDKAKDAVTGAVAELDRRFA